MSLYSAAASVDLGCLPVELAHAGLIRDSQHPAAVLTADLVCMVAAVKAGYLDR